MRTSATLLVTKAYHAGIAAVLQQCMMILLFVLTRPNFVLSVCILTTLLLTK